MKQGLNIINVEALVDRRIPVSQGIKTFYVVKSAVGLLSISKSDFEAIELFRDNRFFKQVLSLRKVPGGVWLRQHLDRVSEALREPLNEMSVRLTEHNRDYGTREQFHSEFKIGLDLERLPSGKFDTKDMMLPLGVLAYNSLRPLGQLGLLGTWRQSDFGRHRP